MMNKSYVFNLNKLLYICCARPNVRTGRHIREKSVGGKCGLKLSSMISLIHSGYFDSTFGNS